MGTHLHRGCKNPVSGPTSSKNRASTRDPPTHFPLHPRRGCVSRLNLVFQHHNAGNNGFDGILPTNTDVDTRHSSVRQFPMSRTRTRQTASRGYTREGGVGARPAPTSGLRGATPAIRSLVSNYPSSRRWRDLDQSFTDASDPHTFISVQLVRTGYCNVRER